ncbi:B12-binding domain-containing radical SAM protein [Pararhodospirillum photometricum]
MLLAASLRENDQWEEAVEIARATLALRPTLAVTFSLLLRCLLDLGRPREALAEARAALTRFPLDAPMGRAAARALTRQGHVDEAVQALQPLGALADHGAAALAQAAHALTTAGRLSEALPLYRSATARAPTLAEAHDGVIACLHGLGRLDEALDARERADRLIPGFSNQRLDFPVPLRFVPLEDAGEGPLDPSRALLVNGIGVLPARPLGVAQIKGAVEAGGAFRCTVVDLNAQVYHQMIRAVRRGETALDFDERAALDDAFARMEGLDPLFVDPEGYKTLAPSLLLGLSLAGRTLQGQFSRADAGEGPVSWIVEACARHLLSVPAAVIGFSITFTDQLAFTLQLARILKARRPEVTLVFGGGFFKDSDLDGFVTEPCVDAVVLGEGERAFLAVLEARRDGRPLAEVPGVVCYDPTTDTLSRRPNTLAVRPAEAPFADFSDLPAETYLTPAPVVPILGSRGCYWRRCTFCNHHASYAASYKATPIARLVDELAHHIGQGVRHFTFVDEMVPAVRLAKLSQAILERGLDLRYYVLAKPTADFTPDCLELMHRAGCVCVYWGLESGSDRVLARMDKGNDSATAAATLAAAARAGIRNHVFLMVGFPGETRTDLKATLDFVHAQRDHIHAAVAGPFVLERGTPVHNEPARFDIRHVYPSRALCDSTLADYEIDERIKGIITQAQAQRYAEVIRAGFLDHLSAYGPCLGTPRDHVVVLYDHAPSAVPAPPLPDPEALWARIDTGQPVPKATMDFTLTPRWRRERAPEVGGST